MSVKQATLYRMVMSDHLCPSGVKAKDFLEKQGFAVDDQPLETRGEVDAFKEKHSVKTTPQIWIEGERIGGYNDLLAHFGEAKAGEGEKTYRPVIAIFSVAALMALALSLQFKGSAFTVQAFEWFVAISVCFLAVQKLQDIEKFSNSFLSYDLLARRWLGYGKVYPFLEALSGVLMLTGSFVGVAAPLMLFIGGIGAISVFKAVYIDKRDLNCACVGGDSNVPLGFVSLTENLMMVGMGVWIYLKIL